MTEFLTGDKQLDRNLKILGDKVAQKAVGSGIRAGLGEVRKGIRANTDNVSARATIAARFKRRRKQGQTVAKVGAGVGKRKEHSPTGGGVGISKQNAHWYFMGTKARTTRSGANRGQMPASPAVAFGFIQNSGAAMIKMRLKIAAMIEKEAKKLKQ